MDYKFSYSIWTKYSLVDLIANNKEIYPIQLYVALVQETDTIFGRELPASQVGTKVYFMVTSKYSKFQDTNSKFWEKKRVNLLSYD